MDSSFLFDQMLWPTHSGEAEEGSINRELRRREEPVFERRCTHTPENIFESPTHSRTKAFVSEITR